MKSLHASILLLAASAVALADDRPETATVPIRRIDLFNGRDFSGLTFFMKDDAAPTNTWTLEHDVIHCSGKPTGYLRTKGTYTNYKLTVEWRFVKVAPNADNTGILVHMQSPDKLWPPCVQCQGRSGKQGDLILMGGAESKEHRGMDANASLPKHEPANEKPVGEWNTVQVVCDGSTVKALVNGKLMNETSDCTVTSGCIGIQCEGAEFEIRSMYVEPLK